MDTLTQEKPEVSETTTTRINEELVQGFKNLIDQLPDIIKTYRLNKSYLSLKSQIPRATLERKLKDKSFTAEEAARLVKAINR